MWGYVVLEAFVLIPTAGIQEYSGKWWYKQIFRVSNIILPLSLDIHSQTHLSKPDLEEYEGNSKQTSALYGGLCLDLTAGFTKYSEKRQYK